MKSLTQWIDLFGNGSRLVPAPAQPAAVGLRAPASPRLRHSLVVSALLVAGAVFAPTPVAAQTTATDKAAVKPAIKPAVKPAVKKMSAGSEKQASVKQNAGKKAVAATSAEAPIGQADSAQMLAYNEVLMGASGCEFGQKIHVRQNARHQGYADLEFNKKTYLMRPVLSSTGALRLEDVRSEVLLIQLGNKTMLMNQKNGQRLVDNCVHANHRAVAASGQPGSLIGGVVK